MIIHNLDKILLGIYVTLKFFVMVPKNIRPNQKYNKNTIFIINNKNIAKK